MDIIVGFITLIFMTALYFLPAIVAYYRNHNNKASILVLNLFLGWTFLGWVIFLAMAFTNNVKNEK